MRVLLMHRDRDFDPHQSLRELMYSYRRDDVHKQRLTAQQQALIQDLELRTLLRAMAGEDEFLWEVIRRAILGGVANDVDTILYRQQVLKDCLNHGQIIRELYDFTVHIIDKTRRSWWDLSSHFPSSVLYGAVAMLEALVSALRKVRSIAEEQGAGFASEGFTRLFAMLRTELGDDYLHRIQDHLTELKFRKGVLLSAQLGDWNESTNLLLCEKPDTTPSLFARMMGKAPPSYTFHLAERDEAGARILSEMRHRGISRVVIALAESADHVLSFFRMLRIELAFYLGCLNLHGRLTAKGEPVCFPAPLPAGERGLRFSGLYDVCLSLHMKGMVVGNAVEADGKKLIIITGANQGGKSTFLRSIGLAQLMMQCGMFVGGERFEGELCPALFTHYKREEDATMEGGKLDEELARMSEIVDHLVPNSMLLSNESFAATNEREGAEIASQIVSALLEKHIKVFFVTHLYAFARSFCSGGTDDVLFLRAERQPDGTRTFQLVEGEPLETSYGEDLYKEVFAPGADTLIPH